MKEVPVGPWNCTPKMPHIQLEEVKSGNIELEETFFF